MNGIEYVKQHATSPDVLAMASRVGQFAAAADIEARQQMSRECSPRTLYGLIGDLREQVMRDTNGGAEVELVDVLRAEFDRAAVPAGLISGKYLPDDERLMVNFGLSWSVA